MDGFDGEGKDQHQPEVARQRSEEAGRPCRLPSPVSRRPEAQQHQKEEQRLAVRREEEQGGGKDGRVEDGPPRHLLGRELSAGQGQQDEQRPEEGEVRNDQRRRERVSTERE